MEKGLKLCHSKLVNQRIVEDPAEGQDVEAVAGEGDGDGQRDGEVREVVGDCFVIHCKTYQQI